MPKILEKASLFVEQEFHTPRKLAAFDLMQGEPMSNPSLMTEAINIKKCDKVVTITPHGRMDVFVAPLLVKQFNRLLDEGYTLFIVDLSDVRVVDVDGDYPLLHLLKRTMDVNGRVTLVCPKNNPVRILYELTQFDQFFDIVETREAAVSHLKQPQE